MAPYKKKSKIYLPLKKSRNVLYYFGGVGGGGDILLRNSSATSDVGCFQSMCVFFFAIYIRTLSSHQYNLECCNKFSTKIYLLLCKGSRFWLRIIKQFSSFKVDMCFCLQKSPPMYHSPPTPAKWMLPKIAPPVQRESFFC